MQGLRSLWSPLLMTLALLYDNKGPSAVCQQKFRTALTHNIWTQFHQGKTFGGESDHNRNKDQQRINEILVHGNRFLGCRSDLSMSSKIIDSDKEGCPR